MLDEEAVGSLSLPLEPVDPNQTVGSLLGHFEMSPDLHAVVVVSGKRPVGLLSRDFLFLHIVNAYGFSLWRDRPLSRLLEERGAGFEVLPAAATLEEASAVVQGRPSGRRFQPVVIVNSRGEYHGLLPVDLLLSEMTRLKLDYALQSNPLTKLPGSRLLERAVERHFNERLPFTLGWADLDDFKSFNDFYGFSRGDRVLLLAAEVLHRHIGTGPNGPLVHLGGDDFAFLLPPESDEEISWLISNEFSKLVPSHYDEAERFRGGVEIEDRHGVRRFRPFSALSIGLVRWEGEPGMTYPKLSELAAEMKTLAKRTDGPSVAVNRRSIGDDLGGSRQG
jgi:diguanylate cyclase (GGDEF)-like protein